MIFDPVMGEYLSQCGADTDRIISLFVYDVKLHWKEFLGVVVHDIRHNRA